MAECELSFFRVVLTVSIVITTVLVTLVTSQSISPWSFMNKTHQEHASDTILSDVSVGKNESDTLKNINRPADDIFQRGISSLILVQILFRHGDRAPTHFYPTDPHKNDWSFGAGELTKQGMLQGYQLGQYIRHYYNLFLGDEFHLNEVYIRSANVHRTMVNAECLAAGLFPGNFSTKMSWPLGQWQPIPVHTFPSEIDSVLSPLTACSYVLELFDGLQALYSSKGTLLKDKELMFQLSHHTDMEMNVKTLHQLSDNIYYLKAHGMTLPSWLTKDMENKLIEYHLARPSFLEEQARYLAGMLLLDMLSNMHGKIENSQDFHKTYLYSGHDMNIHALMAMLEVYNKEDVTHVSPSAFIIELHHQDNHHFIRLLYKEDDNRPPKVLIAPGCVSILCPLAKFEKLYGESLQGDWDQVCGQQVEEGFIDFGDQTVPIFISLLTFVLLMNVILLYKVCLYHSKLKRTPFKDDYSLVQTQTDSNEEEDEMENLSNNSNHHSGVQNGGGKIKHLKRKHQNQNDSTFSDSDNESCEETTLFMSPHKT